MIPHIGEWTNDFDEIHRLIIPIQEIYEDTPFYESFNNSDLCSNYSNGIRLLWCLIKTNITFLINLLFVMVCLFVSHSNVHDSTSEQIQKNNYTIIEKYNNGINLSWLYQQI